jgi:hypothetical protein
VTAAKHAGFLADQQPGRIGKLLQGFIVDHLFRHVTAGGFHGGIWHIKFIAPK